MFLLTAGELEFETFSFRTVNPIRSKKDPEDMARDNPFIAALSFLRPYSFNPRDKVIQNTQINICL